MTNRRYAMKKKIPAADPDAYVAALDGWRRALVEELRAAVRGASTLQEVVKWGHLVYLANGPVLLIRAEDHRVLLGFWRGQRLRGIEPRLRPVERTRWPAWSCAKVPPSIPRPCAA
jgi:hypothetical protein